MVLDKRTFETLLKLQQCLLTYFTIQPLFQDMFADNFDSEKQARKDEEEARKKEEEKAEEDAMNLVLKSKSKRTFRITIKSCRMLNSVDQTARVEASYTDAT